MPFVVTWMDPGSVTLSEVCQTEEEKYCIISLICRNNTNEFTKQKESQRLQELIVAGGTDGAKGYLGSLGWTCTHSFI